MPRKTMTAAALINALNAYPANTRVCIASDAEGNSYSPVDEAAPALWNGEEVIHPDDKEGDEEEIICLYPV